ncbi:MAG: hypothetical protein ACLQDV_14560 [Candidatus Binataceae bacterium]
MGKPEIERRGFSIKEVAVAYGVSDAFIRLEIRLASVSTILVNGPDLMRIPAGEQHMT